MSQRCVCKHGRMVTFECQISRWKIEGYVERECSDCRTMVGFVLMSVNLRNCKLVEITHKHKMGGSLRNS